MGPEQVTALLTLSRAPPHSESRPESYQESPSAPCPLPKTLRPGYPLAHSFPSSLGSPQHPGKVPPHLHPPFLPPLLSRVTHLYYFVSPQPYCFLTYLLVLLMLCPLREGKDFCLFYSLMPPMAIVKIFNIRFHQGRRPPLPPMLVFSR